MTQSPKVFDGFGLSGGTPGLGKISYAATTGFNINNGALVVADSGAVTVKTSLTLTGNVDNLASGMQHNYSLADINSVLPVTFVNRGKGGYTFYANYNAGTATAYEFYCQGGTVGAKCEYTGAWTLGPASGAIHTANGQINISTVSSSYGFSLERTGTSAYKVYMGVDSTSGLLIGTSAGGVEFGKCTAGAWTLGAASAASAIAHTVNTGGASGGGSLKLVTGAALNAGSGTYVQVSDGPSSVKATIGVFYGAGSSGSGYIGMISSGSATEQYMWHNGGVWYTNNGASTIGGTSGTVIGTQTSDIRTKNISSENNIGLQGILPLRTINYTSKKGNPRERVGFDAQQMQSYIPQAVYNTGSDIELELDNVLAVDSYDILAVAVKAIQELSAQNDQQQSLISQQASSLASQAVLLEALTARLEVADALLLSVTDRLTALENK